LVTIWGYDMVEAIILITNQIISVSIPPKLRHFFYKFLVVLETLGE